MGIVLAAEIFTFIMNSVQSFIWWNYWSGELILIGTIDALFIAGILAPLVIALVTQTARYAEFRRMTEAREKEQAELSEEEKKFKHYVENSIDAVTVVDANGYIIYESPSVKRIFGYDPQDLVGRSAFEFIHPDDLKFALDIFSKAVNKPFSTNELEVRFLKKNGEWAYIHISGKNMITDPVIKGIILNVSDTTERRAIEDQLKKSIAEKDTLMKEIHHRVKNNFMTVSSLLSIQAEMLNDTKVNGVFLECQNRINSMALIHEKLYQSDNFSEIEIHSYVQRLISFIQSSYIGNGTLININLHIDNSIKLETGRAIAVGLILNELLSNIYKYAFPKSCEAEVHISIFKKNNFYNLTVKDNGAGFPEEFDISTSRSLGLKLVQMMTLQMHGSLEMSGKNGAEFKIEFPV